MKTSSDPSKWSKEEFITFLMLHASYADLEFTDSEKEAILAKTNAETFQHITELYNGMGEYQRLEFIANGSSHHFDGIDDKHELLNILKSQFHIDGELTRLESISLEFLRRLLY